MGKFLLISRIFLTWSSDFIIFYFLLLFLYAWLWKREKCTVSESNVWKGLNRFFFITKEKEKKGRPRRIFQTWRWTLRAKKALPSIDAVYKVKGPMYKSKSWKAGQRKGEYGSVHSYSKTWFKKRERERERKLWTKGKKRHKRRWIIQYAPLVDSFVILYNGPLEKNQVIAWKRSLFLSHHALMLGKKTTFFLQKCPMFI